MGSRGNLGKEGVKRRHVRALRSLRREGCGVVFGRSWRGIAGAFSGGGSSMAEVRSGSAGSGGLLSTSSLDMLMVFNEAD